MVSNDFRIIFQGGCKIIACSESRRVIGILKIFNIRQCKGAAWRYILLCVAVMVVSGLAVSGLYVLTGINSSIIKIVVDLILFFVNYRIQKSWVFARPKGE